MKESGCVTMYIHATTGQREKNKRARGGMNTKIERRTKEGMESRFKMEWYRQLSQHGAGVVEMQHQWMPMGGCGCDVT